MPTRCGMLQINFHDEYAIMSDTPIIEMKDWLAKSTLKFFERHESVMMVPRVVELGSPLAVKLLSRTFEPMSRDSFYISTSARGILADRVSGKIYQEDEIFKAELMLSSQLEKLNDYLNRRIEQAEQKMRAAGEDPTNIASPALRYRAKCATRTTKDWLDTIKKIDIYMTMLEFLHISGELSDTDIESQRAKLHNEHDMRTHAHNIPREAARQYSVIRRICSAVLDGRMEERAAQSQRDKAAALQNKEAKDSAGDTTKNEPVKATAKPKKAKAAAAPETS